MSGIIVLLILLGLEIAFTIYCSQTKARQASLKHQLRLIMFTLFSILLIGQVLQWSFRWLPLFVLLLIQAVIAVTFFIRKPLRPKSYKPKALLGALLGRCLLLLILTFPAILFPQYDPPAVTGEYPVRTEIMTLTDHSRPESYGHSGEKRKLTIQFWYPEGVLNGRTFPLVLFSHGAFGFRGSNHSTLMNLASHGYVVCSIDHTYQAFFSKQEDGKIVLVDKRFFHDVMAVQNGAYEEKKIYELTHRWLQLRTEDMNFVLNTILEQTRKENTARLFRLIDREKIGLFGHSLGGATAAELGRMRKDIDAVIVLDGTMIGEAIDFTEGKTVLNPEPYPVPLLNVYNEQHYREAAAHPESYENTAASARAIAARQTVFRAAGHLNFTDLPLFSPLLAKRLGTGPIDAVYCIETMNRVVLNFFDYYLKNKNPLQILDQY